MSSSTPTTGFKVIVVGGGPVGLIAAHALSRANIDFVLLEGRPDIVIKTGSDLVLNNSGMRVLNQLGLLDPLDAVTTDLSKMLRIDHKGRNLGHVNFLDYEKDFFGEAPRVLSRRDLTATFYDNLPDAAKARCLPAKRVSTITTSADNTSVTVTCRDDTSYTANLIIAADGAHSIVRQQMRTLAIAHNASLPSTDLEAPINDEEPYLTTFRCFWLRFPSILKEIPAGTTAECHGPGATTQLFAAEDTTVCAVYERLPSPTKERIRWTEDDKLSCVDKWGHLPLAPGSNMTLRSAWETATETGLVSLEEGVVQNWSFDGRIVLAGDAAHKFTPSTGAGCNNGIVDIVVLVNELNRVLSSSASSSSSTGIPDKAAIANALQTYQTKRFKAVTNGCAVSGRATHAASWPDLLTRLFDTYVISIQMFQRWMATKAAEGATSKTPVFDFFEGKDDRKSGSVEWAFKQRAPQAVL